MCSLLALSPAHRQFLKTLGNPMRMELMLFLLKKPATVTRLVRYGTSLKEA